MKPKIILILLIFIAVAKSGYASVVISSGSYEVAANSTKTVAISIANNVAISAFQFDLVIPDHFSLVDGSVQLTGRENGHDFSWELIDGNILRCIAYSTDEAAFSGNSGAIVEFILSSGTKPGTYSLNIENPIVVSGGSDILSQINNGSIVLRAPEISVSTTSINFGEIPLFQQSSRSFTIQNTGNSTLTVSGLSVSYADYSLNSTGSFTINAGSSVSRTVTFYATEKGLKEGEISITSDCPANPVQSIQLSTLAFAVNEIHLGAVSGRSGYLVTLPISINNMEPFTGFQTEIILPEQATFVPGSEQLTARAAGHQILADTTENKLIITAFSGSNESFSGEDGQVASVDLYLEGNGGYYPLQISNAIIADENADNILSAYYNTNVRIQSPNISLSSSSYNFGEISVLDSSNYTFTIRNYGDDTLKVNSILSTSPKFTLPGLQLPNVIPPSGNKTVSVLFKSDQEGEYNGKLVIRSNDSERDPIYFSTIGETFNPNELLVNNAIARQGEPCFVNVDMDNLTEISAFQFDLIVPEGITVDKNSTSLSDRKNGHSLAINAVSGNIYRFICYSGSLNTFSGNSGEIIQIAIQLSPDVAVGTYPLQLQNVVLSNINGQNVTSGFSNGNLEIQQERDKQTLVFQKGWNIFSLNIIPDSTDLMDIFQPLIDNGNVIKIQNENGFAIENQGVFGGWKNDIGNLNLEEGYKIRMSETDSIQVYGTHVTLPFILSLEEGWNIMGYPKTSEYNAMQVVQSLINDQTLVKVQDEKGNSIENLGIYGGWQNFIGNFTPGEGYKIKVCAPDTLWIYESYPKSIVIQPKSAATTYFMPAYSGNGVDHMNFNLVEIPAIIFNAGDEIAVYDNTICVGAVKLTEDNLRNRVVSIPASAKDDLGMAGFTEDNTYNLRIWNAEQNLEAKIEAEHISGPEQFTKHESVILSLEKSALTDVNDFGRNGLADVNCYPNPFASEITIEIKLPVESKVSVIVIDQFGQEINRLLEADILASGITRIVWDGSANSGQKVSSGFYYLRISSDDFSFNKKILFKRK